MAQRAAKDHPWTDYPEINTARPIKVFTLDLDHYTIERRKITQESPSVEKYRFILESTTYRVSNTGIVQSCTNGRFGTNPGNWKPIGGSLDEHGRPRVAFRINGVSVYRKICRLVLEAFGPPRPPGAICCHRDGNPANNNIDNLYWGTHSTNSADMVRHGRAQIGAKCHAAKINEADVREIFRLRSEGLTLTKIASRFDISFSHVGYILRGETWKHLNLRKT